MSDHDHLDVLRLFIRITEVLNFRQAAGDTGFTPSQASRAIQRLEDRLGARLLERTTRIVRPTEAGLGLALRARAVLADLEDAEAEVRGGAASGLIRVDVQGTLARRFVLPHLQDFLAQNPGLKIRISETERFVDLIREGVDCVLRVGQLQDSSLVGRKIALLPEVVVASPAYLQRHGTPKTPEDLLNGHVAVGFVRPDGREFPFRFKRKGEEFYIAVPSRLSVSGAESYTRAAELGLGIVQKPRYNAEAALADGRLVEVLPEFAPGALPVSILHPPGRRMPPRVRLFTDWMAGLFAVHVG